MKSLNLQILEPNPPISVVIPLFNAKRYVAAALESVFAQTYPVGEILIVDDGSTDDPWSVLSGYEGRIRYLRGENHGAGHARNIGVAAAKGTLIAFLDADDMWVGSKLEKQVRVLQARNSALVYCGRREFDGEGNYLGEFEQTEFPQGRIFEKLIEQNHISTASAVIIRRDVFEAFGGFKENPALKVSEDFELWCRVALSHDIGAVSEPLVKYRLHDSNITWSKKACYLGKVAALTELKAELESGERANNRLLNSVIRKLLETHQHYALGFIQEQQYTEARMALQALAAFPEATLPWELRVLQGLPDTAIWLLHEAAKVIRGK